MVVTDLVGGEVDLGTPRRLNETGHEAVEAVAEAVAPLVDNLLNIKWNRRTGQAATEAAEPAPEAVEATCACGSGIPVLTMTVGDRRETLIAVPAIFDQLFQQGKRPDTNSIAAELLEMTRLYNSMDEAEIPGYRTALLREFETYCRKKER